MSEQPDFLPEGALAALGVDDAEGWMRSLGDGEWSALGPAGEPAGFWAAKLGALACLGAWEARWGSEWARAKDARGRGAAHWVAAGRQQGAEITLEWLGKRGAELDEPDALGATPLGLALALGHGAAAAALIERGWAGLEGPCAQGLTPIELLASLRWGSERLELALARAGSKGVGKVAGPLAGAPLELARAAAFRPSIQAMLEANEIEASAARAAPAGGAKGL